jgi:hypothetical protein
VYRSGPRGYRDELKSAQGRQRQRGSFRLMSAFGATWPVARVSAKDRIHQSRPPADRPPILVLGPRATRSSPPSMPNIENCGDSWVRVHLDRQHGGFCCTNPELAISATRARPSPQPWHDGHDDNDQPGRRRAQSRKSCRWPRSCSVSWPKPKRPCRGRWIVAETAAPGARCAGTPTGSFLRL